MSTFTETKTRLESLGAYLPEKVETTQETISHMVNKQPFDLEVITGIEERRVHGENETSFDIALSAAKDCLEKSSYSPEDIDVIIVPSITRFNEGTNKFMFEPCLSLYLKQELGLKNAIHMDVSNACAGMMTAVYTVDAMIKSGAIKTGLVVSGEYITCIAETAKKEINEPWDAQFGSLTVGDSGVAVILDEAQDEDDYIDYIELLTAAEHSELCIGKPSDQNKGVALYTNNNEMHKRDRIETFAHFITRYYKETGRDMESENFDWAIHHQVGVKAINNFARYIEEGGGFTLAKPLNCVEKLGNTATTSHFIDIYYNLKNGTLKPGEKILAIPAASGIVTGCLSVKITNLKH